MATKVNCNAISLPKTKGCGKPILKEQPKIYFNPETKECYQVYGEINPSDIIGNKKYYIGQAELKADGTLVIVKP